MPHWTPTQFDTTITQAEPDVSGRVRVDVVGAPIDVLSWAAAESRISQWAESRESRYVCICNVHSVVTAREDAELALAIQGADMATPDGAPVAWLLRRMGFLGQKRINGPDLMLRYLRLAAARGEGVFLYGSTTETLGRLRARLLQSLPSLKVVGSYSPPFRSLTLEEDSEVIRQINDSGARTVWVSLGCPKQEKWMADHRNRIQSVMVGVGAAFEYHAGVTERAPRWMQKRGLEWLHRLWSEPGRLWRRYLRTNSIFLLRAGIALLRRPCTSQNSLSNSSSDSKRI